MKTADIYIHTDIYKNWYNKTTYRNALFVIITVEAN